MEQENNQTTPIAKAKMAEKKSSFFKGDFSSISNYIRNDVVLPKLKELIYSIGTNGLDMLLNGDTVHAKRNQRLNQMPSYMTYWKSQMTSNIPEPTSPMQSPLMRPRVSNDVYAYEHVVIEGETMYEARQKAEDIIHRLRSTISEYGSVNVSTFYGLVGMPSTHVDVKFGWYNLDTAYPERYSDNNVEGYVIRFPKAIMLSN